MHSHKSPHFLTSLGYLGWVLSESRNRRRKEFWCLLCCWPSGGFSIGSGRGEDEHEENKEEKADAKSYREGEKKIERRTKSTQIFEDSSTHPGGRGEVCEAASGFRVILLFRGHKVSDAFSGFGEMCPCLMMYWHP